MATYWTMDENKWFEIGDDVDLEKFAQKKLDAEANQDSDGGYWASLVFWRDGIYTYALGEYDGYSQYYDLCGEMREFVYGTLEEVRNCGSWHAKSIHETKLLPPNRDWIKV